MSAPLEAVVDGNASREQTGRWSRTYFHHLIVSRFRHYRNKHEEIASARSAEAVAKWQAGLDRRSRRLLSVLTRANCGQLRPFERVLQLTYARKGARRRYLLTRLMHPDSSADEIVPFPSPKKMLSGSGNHKAQWRPPPLMTALLESQRLQQGQFSWSNYKLRPVGPALQEKTIWGKPMPQRRIKNAWVRWYALHADRLYVPLSEDEYQGINAVAEGSVKVRGLPRRPRATVPVFDATASLSTDEGGGADSLLTDYEKKKKRRLLDVKSPRRLINTRFVQRRMAQLLKHVPRQLQPPGSDKPPIFEWRDGIGTGRFTLHQTSTEQNKLLFG
ncbi:hypothetical protein DV735_g3354, partial [Chaetothyriales sp. CBS 134920]